MTQPHPLYTRDLAHGYLNVILCLPGGGAALEGSGTLARVCPRGCAGGWGGIFVEGRKASIAPLGALSGQAQMALQEGFPHKPRALGWKQEANQSSQYN